MSLFGHMIFWAEPKFSEYHFGVKIIREWCPYRILRPGLFRRTHLILKYSITICIGQYKMVWWKDFLSSRYVNTQLFSVSTINWFDLSLADSCIDKVWQNDCIVPCSKLLGLIKLQNNSDSWWPKLFAIWADISFF